MKKMIYCVGIVLAMSGAVVATQPSFVIDKKKGSLSCNKLKEQAIDQLGDTLRTLPALLRSIADIQEQVQKAVEAYITGQKGCFWDVAGKEQLSVCCSTLEQGNLQLEVLGKQLQEFAAYAKKLG